METTLATLDAQWTVELRKKVIRSSFVDAAGKSARTGHGGFGSTDLNPSRRKERQDGHVVSAIRS